MYLFSHLSDALIHINEENDTQNERSNCIVGSFPRSNIEQG